MFLITSGILVILGFIYKNNKRIFNLQFLWIWILVSFNNGGSDYVGYQDMFKAFSLHLDFNFLTGGKLYSLGAYLFNKIGFSLEEYTFFTTTIALLLIYYLMKKYSSNISFVNSCLILFPLTDNIIQKRNFLAMVAILYGILFLIEKNRYYTIKFLFFVLVSYNFHILGIVYLFLILIPYFSLKSIKIISYIGTIFTIIIIPFLDKIAKFCFSFVSSKVNVYFEDLSLRLPLHKVAFFVFIHLVMFYFVLFFYKTLKEKNKFSISIMKLNYLFLLVIPLYYYNSTFLRFYRNVFLLNYIFIGNCLVKKEVNKLKENTGIFFIIYLISLFLIMYVLFGQARYEGLIKPLFEHNYILNIIWSKL